MTARIACLALVGIGGVTLWLLVVAVAFALIFPDFWWIPTAVFGLLALEGLGFIISNDIDEKRIAREHDSITH